MTITATGFYDGVPAETYHGRLTDVPSLSSSGAREIMNTCPARFWARSYLNPQRVSEKKQEFDLGTAAHLALLEPHLLATRVRMIDAPDYRKGSAQAERDDAYAAGLTPLLTKQADQIGEMREALIRRGHYEKWISGGVIERSFVAKDETLGIAFKARPDVFHNGKRIIVVDYKTTSDANPRGADKKFSLLGYERQEAWYRSVIASVLGRPIDRFVFLVQETAAPYESVAIELDPRAVEWGSLQNAKAVELFWRCLQSGVWPGYPDGDGEGGTHRIGLPVYAEMQLEERHERGEFQIIDETAAKRAWYEAQQPQRVTA